MLKLIKSANRKLNIFKRMLQKDKKRPFQVSFTSYWKSWLNGFLPESHVIYNIPFNNANDYVNDFQRLDQAPLINGNNSILLDNKLLFSYLLSYEKRVLHPELYISSGKFVSFRTGEMIKEESLTISLKGKEYVLKPAGGGGGAGIFFLKLIEDRWVSNEKSYSHSDLINFQKKSKGDILLYRKINQTGFAAEINSASLNTIRMVTYVDPKSGEAFLGAAVFRCGVINSGPVDNWSSGGLSIFVNVDSGKMGLGTTFPFRGKIEWASEHPDSGISFEGQIIPNWNNMKNYIVHLAQRFSFLPYIAWDVVPMESDLFILEANSNSDVNLLQVHQPLLKSPRLKEFYNFYNIS